MCVGRWVLCVCAHAAVRVRVCVRFCAILLLFNLQLLHMLTPCTHTSLHANANICMHTRPPAPALTHVHMFARECARTPAH